jgi:hypothetical protein
MGQKSRVDAQDYQATIEAFSFDFPAVLYGQLHDAVIKQRIKLSEFEKLDFTWPDQPGFGSNSQYEVFNPQSPRYLGPIKMPAQFLDDVTTVSSTHIFFNLRRYVGSDGKIGDHLFIVIPNMKQEACNATDRPIFKANATFVIPPDNHTIAVDTVAPTYACVETPDHKLYLMGIVFSRFKQQESSPWTP